MDFAMTDFPATLLDFLRTAGRVAASLPFAARNRGAVVVNLEPTPLTEKADFFLQGKSGEALPVLARAVWG
jgi:NAD-dependent SIR2 family protein deacetylase